MLKTTKPCEAIRGASQARLSRVAVKPGAIATAPNVPALVSFGAKMSPPPKPLTAVRAIVVLVVANGP